VVAVAVLASRRIIAVGIAFHVHNLIAGLSIEDDGGLQILRGLSRSWNSRGNAAHAIAPPATMAPFSECYIGHVIREDLIALRGIHQNYLLSGMDNGGLVRSNCADRSALCASPSGRPWKGVPRRCDVVGS
jgi:hypothetical protein